MTTQQKRRLLLSGFLLSAVHFTLTSLCKDARLLLRRPEDMIGSGDTKPYWPTYPLADMLEGLGDILRLPADCLWTQGMPDLITVVLFVANSFVWGFTLAVLLSRKLAFYSAPLLKRVSGQHYLSWKRQLHLTQRRKDAKTQRRKG